jgi:SAM-dependent methyltransferase
MVGYNRKEPWYKEWFNSPYYHKLFSKRNETEASGFIDKLIHFLHPLPASQMLDTGCGRGRHAIHIAEKGFFVTGIDIAPENIQYARQYENDHLEFFQHDMRLPFRVNYYDYAFNFFTSFGYFRTRREHEDTIRTIAGSLKPNGTFVIDYLNVHYTEEHLVNEEEMAVGSTIYQIRRWQDETHFFKNTLVSDSSLSSPLSFTEKVTKFSLGDFTEMFAYQHMQVTHVFGDYQLNAYDTRHTPRMIITARKIR